MLDGEINHSQTDEHPTSNTAPGSEALVRGIEINVEEVLCCVGRTRVGGKLGKERRGAEQERESQGAERQIFVSTTRVQRGIDGVDGGQREWRAF